MHVMLKPGFWGWDISRRIFNGGIPSSRIISMMLYEKWPNADEVFSSDACLKGCGGFWQESYFHASYPSEFMENNNSINILEMYAIIMCLKLWGEKFRCKRIKIFCNNEFVCLVLNSGRSRNETLQSCLREITFNSALYEFQIKAVYLDGKMNRVAEHLSRWNDNIVHWKKLFDLTKKFQLKECFFVFWKIQIFT